MKKWMIGLLSFALVTGVGTSVFAQGDDVETIFSDFLPFEEAKPFMEEMHPEFSDEELEQMYVACHGPADGTSGQPGQGNAASGMMDQF